MKRVSVIGLAAAATMFAGTALADNEAGMYGNTVVCTYPDGAVTKVYLQQGGTYTVVRGGQTIQGTWKDDGTNVCYVEANSGTTGAKPVCVPNTAWKVGDTWQVTDPVGKTCTAVLTAGQQ